MANNKKFFWGLALGLISSKLYNSSKKELRSIAVKTVEETLFWAEESKSFFDDISTEAKLRNAEKYKNRLKKEKE
ncbi:hypothetical protein [Clostridium ganghwense]|uniref:YtxH domain-containing protein n=1 Tax=Clostridium ganghwense TaxID=312089 RepID=A0ABT4CP84_9CLOT|nr:hypothetical protein [Clostridium ganghwense]MCY6370258.1 hypothetical protein [Clostridium ganghwense]